MKVLTECTAAIPVRLRPATEQVCSWYEHTLRARGADVRRTSPTTLEFTLPVMESLFDLNLSTSLAALAGGELEVSEAPDGFTVSIEAKARTWVTVLPLTALAVATGGVAFFDSPIKYVLAAAAIGLLGVGWLRTRTALDRLLEGTNEEIMRSCAEHPPVAHGALPPADAQP